MSNDNTDLTPWNYGPTLASKVAKYAQDKGLTIAPGALDIPPATTEGRSYGPFEVPLTDGTTLYALTTRNAVVRTYVISYGDDLVGCDTLHEPEFTPMELAHNTSQMDFVQVLISFEDPRNTAVFPNGPVLYVFAAHHYARAQGVEATDFTGAPGTDPAPEPWGPNIDTVSAVFALTHTAGHAIVDAPETNPAPEGTQWGPFERTTTTGELLRIGAVRNHAGTSYFVSYGEKMYTMDHTHGQETPLTWRPWQPSETVKQAQEYLDILNAHPKPLNTHHQNKPFMTEFALEHFSRHTPPPVKKNPMEAFLEMMTSDANTEEELVGVLRKLIENAQNARMGLGCNEGN